LLRTPPEQDNTKMRRPFLFLFAAAVLAFSASSFAADKFLADRHVARGSSCESCHTTEPPKSVPMKQCLSCHGSYAKLAKATENLDINPHDNHMGETDCRECHQGHRKPRLVCDQCHEFRQLKVP